MNLSLVADFDFSHYLGEKRGSYSQVPGNAHVVSLKHISDIAFISFSQSASVVLQVPANLATILRYTVAGEGVDLGLVGLVKSTCVRTRTKA